MEKRKRGTEREEEQIEEVERVEENESNRKLQGEKEMKKRRNKNMERRRRRINWRRERVSLLLKDVVKRLVLICCCLPLNSILNCSILPKKVETIASVLKPLLKDSILLRIM